MKRKIGLVLHTSLGCTVDNKDFLFPIDEPLTVIDYTAEEIEKYRTGIRISNAEYYKRIVTFIRLYREVAACHQEIQLDIDKINKKWEHLRFGTVDAIHPFDTEICTQMDIVCRFTAFHAILSIRHPKLYKVFMEALEFLKTKSGKYKDYNPEGWGGEYRDASVFDRAIFHYNSLQVQSY